MKETCIEFVINKVSVQGNNVKIKLKMKMNFKINLCEINDKTPVFCLVLSEAYSKSCETLNMKCSPKIVIS